MISHNTTKKLHIDAGKHSKTYLWGIVGILSVTAVWGSSFVFMKNALDYIGPLWFLGVRFFFGALLLWLIAGRSVRTLDLAKLKAGFLTALPLWAAYLTQTIGLTRTTASNCAFITGTYVVIVSLLAWFKTRRIKKNQLLLAFLTFGALAVFSLDQHFSMAAGDLWTLLGALMYAIHFMVLDHYASTMDNRLLSALQLSFAALFNIIAALFTEPLPTAANFPPVVWSALLFTALLATAYANLMQTAVQTILPPTTASILFTSESVFGGFFGWLLLREVLSARQAVGAALLIACMIGAVLTGSSKTEAAADITGAS